MTEFFLDLVEVLNIPKIKRKSPMCKYCIYFRKYNKSLEEGKWEDGYLGEGFCKDPNPLDGNQPRFKVDYCDHLEYKEDKAK